MKSYDVTCCDNNMEIHVVENSVVKIICNICGKMMFSFPGAEEKSQTRKISNEEDFLRQGSSAIFLDRYQIIKKISEGNFAKVYLAFDPKNKEKIALKVLKFRKLPASTNNAKLSNNFVNFFIREAQILTELNHHSIVKIKGAGNTKGNPYLVMEYIAGPTLQDAIEEIDKEYDLILLIILRIASALEYGYDNFKIIHRDVKPQNIILARDRNRIPMLIDFGLARSLGNHYHSLTIEGIITGTPNYMPHEHFTQSGIDHRSDIYALGATLYFMLTKHHPYHNIKDIVDIFHAIKQQKLIPVESFVPGAPKEIVSIVKKCMAFSKEERYPDYISIRKDIENVIENL